MTYRLEPWVEKIMSPITVILPGGEKRKYNSGKKAAQDVFDKHYVVNQINAVCGEITLRLDEVETRESGWIGEEQTFF